MRLSIDLQDFGIILHGNHGIRDFGVPAPFSRECNNSNIQDQLFSLPVIQRVASNCRRLCFALFATVKLTRDLV